jgi:hypothetical protein
MLMNEPASFIKSYLEEVNQSIKELNSEAQLTRRQKAWLGFCLTGMLLVNGINWAKFERAGLGKYKIGALSWVFRHAPIAWNTLFIASVKLLLKQCGITKGILVLDESDRARSKRTKRLYKTYKQKDKATGGYVNGQTIVLLLLVSDSVTIPVGFAFYMPDPILSAWRKEDNRLITKGVSTRNRPLEPKRNPNYPTKVELGLNLLDQFKENYPEVTVKAILADALYGESQFLDQAAHIWGQVQVISQLHKNQNIWYKGRKRTLEDYFNSINRGVIQTVLVRGQQETKAWVSSARLKVDAHGKKRLVIALKYENEDHYRYLVAAQLSWRTQDIIQAYTLRWLIEVVFEDWKLYEGWGREAKQLDEEGSSRGLILSLLLDHGLLLHPKQLARLTSKLPAYTVGSLQRLAQMEILLEFIESLLQSHPVGEKLKELGDKIQELFQLRPSQKHLSGIDLGRLEPTPSLTYRC